ncbi:hypothetical protein ACFLYW_03730, partial [Thermodesulfobacteriota bacterium]
MKKLLICLALLTLAQVFVIGSALAAECNSCHETAHTACNNCHSTAHNACLNCHVMDPDLPNPHHGTTNAMIGACEYCHEDPRPDFGAGPGDNGDLSGLNYPTQLACQECHVSFDGGQLTVTRFTRTDYISYAEDYDRTPVDSHTIPNTSGTINNYGICLGCHTTLSLWHARPDKNSPTGVHGEWIYGGYTPEERCTGGHPCNCYWQLEGVPDALSWARYAPGRSSGTIGDFNLHNLVGFGYDPGNIDLGQDHSQCLDAHDYQSSPLNFELTMVNGIECQTNQNPPAYCSSTDREVPVFPSLCPMVVVNGVGVEDCPLASPTLVNEPNAYCETDSCAVTLNWSTVSDPDVQVVGYYVEVDNNADFSSPEYFSNKDNWITATSFTQLMAKGTYYWRVMAHDNNDPSDESAWSQPVDTFLLQDAVPLCEVPQQVWVLTSHNYNGQVGYPPGQNKLRWNASANAANYYV